MKTKNNTVLSQWYIGEGDTAWTFTAFMLFVTYLINPLAYIVTIPLAGAILWTPGERFILQWRIFPVIWYTMPEVWRFMKLKTRRIAFFIGKCMDNSPAGFVEGIICFGVVLGITNIMFGYFYFLYENDEIVPFIVQCIIGAIFIVVFFLIPMWSHRFYQQQQEKHS